MPCAVNSQTLNVESISQDLTNTNFSAFNLPANHAAKLSEVIFHVAGIWALFNYVIVGDQITKRFCVISATDEQIANSGHLF